MDLLFIVAPDVLESPCFAMQYLLSFLILQSFC